MCIIANRRHSITCPLANQRRSSQGLLLQGGVLQQRLATQGVQPLLRRPHRQRLPPPPPVQHQPHHDVALGVYEGPSPLRLTLARGSLRCRLGGCDNRKWDIKTPGGLF